MNMPRSTRSTLTLLLVCCIVIPVLMALMPASPVLARQTARRQLTADDYRRAESFLRPNTQPLVFGDAVRPVWLANDRFWYRTTTPDGAQFILVDPASGSRTLAFDHERLAQALSAVSDTTYTAMNLPFRTFDFTGDQHAIAFTVHARRFSCDVETYRCQPQDRMPARFDRNSSVSPDGQRAAFIRDDNLWVRDLDSGRETQLTTDGVQDFGYATDNAGWTKSDRPVLRWSPGSDKIATFQHDGRGVGEMYLVSTKVGHPDLEAWKYPLPGDSLIFRIQRVIVDVDPPRVVRFQMPPDPHRSTLCDHVACRGEGFTDTEWSPDGTQLAFVSSSRDHKSATLRVADAATGAVRTVYEETADTFYESGYRKVNWHFLPESNEFIWFSERSNWGHLYLYDLDSGQLKHPITSGDWNVLQLLRVDRENRMLYFTGAGREPGDPYFQYLYKVGMDGNGLMLLTPDSSDHAITFSPSGEYFIDAASTPETPPVTVLRDLDGNVVTELEKADVSKLVAAGWHAPIPFTVKARDGQTDLYGLMYRPTDFDPSASYPIINYVYPGPQTGSVGSRSFSPSRGDKQSLAELGFIVVEVDAMGTPMRSKAFHEAYYGDMGDNGLPDQIATIKQLAARYPWMDLDRVGIWGHSGGGFASADGILRYPDFYKVAWSESGNHDNRIYEDDWGEKWQGLLAQNPDGTTNYDNQANQLLARNLKGKLMLVHGAMDNNVPPNNTLEVVDALIKANKDFDMLFLPNQRHGYGRDSAYVTRRRWDYFVENLMGAEPPKEYRMGGE